MQLKDVVKFDVSEEDRLHNVVVFGLEELNEDDLCEAEDEELVDDIMEQLNVWQKRVVQIEHVGQHKDE